jgi:hypothetical protein
MTFYLVWNLMNLKIQKYENHYPDLKSVSEEFALTAEPVLSVVLLTDHTVYENLDGLVIIIIQKQGEKIKPFGLYAFSINFIMIGPLISYQIL